MSTGYLITYKNDSWRDQMAHYGFTNRSGFTSWPGSQNDKISSFRFKLPIGWDLHLHEHRNSSSRSKVWRGNGREILVNKSDMPGFIHDDASGHSWVRLYHASIQRAFDTVQPQGPSDANITKGRSARLPAGASGSLTWHQQGIQKTKRGGFVVSGSAPDTGYLYFTDARGSIIRVLTPTHSNFNHLGGCQVVDDFLAVGYERYENKEAGPSKVLFYDIADTLRPTPLDHLSIFRNNESAGAVGLVRLGNQWLAIVGNWGSQRLDFYRSTALDLRNPSTRFESMPRWTWTKSSNGFGSGSIDNNWEGYQNINVFSQAGRTPQLNDLWFVGMHTDQFPSMEDWADLYHLDLSGNAPVITKKGKKHFHNSGDGQRFIYASGFYYDTRVRAFEVYSAEAHLNATLSHVNRWL